MYNESYRSNEALKAFANNLGNSPQAQESSKQAIAKLVADLEKEPYSAQRDEIIKKAKQSYYSDFGSPVPMPTMQLVSDLNGAGLKNLAKQAMDGTYDEQ